MFCRYAAPFVVYRNARSRSCFLCGITKRCGRPLNRSDFALTTVYGKPVLWVSASTICLHDTPTPVTSPPVGLACHCFRTTTPNTDFTKMAGRALHFVFKVAERTKTIKFYRELLGMKILRHEEFTEGCEAACNGPYDNRWSKTMVGYGPEDTHFVIELTYNYGVDDYKLGNDFLGITLKSSKVLENAKSLGWPIEIEDSMSFVVAPGGYKFYVIDEPQPVDKDPVVNVMLSSTNLTKSVKFWNGVLGLRIFSQTEALVELGFGDDQVKLKLRDIGEPINHATAYGRIAFSVPTADLKSYQENAKNNQYKILTPFVTLDTPGKASVSVVIFADTDGHEICFVGDKEFRELSQFDPDSEKQLDKYIVKDEARKLKN